MNQNKQSYCVIIPSYQRPEMLKRAIASVYAQTVLPDTIYLVIDEPEDSARYAFLQGYDERIVTTHTGGGYGGAKARNVGLDQATEEFVFFLDDDDEWLPEKVEKQIKLLERRAGAVGVTCGRTEKIAGKPKSVDVLSDEAKLNRRIRAENLTGSFSQFGFRRSALPEIRLVPELASAQDFEFYMRICNHGRIVVVPECLILYYRHGEGCITGSLENKVAAYRIIDELHAAESSSFDRRFRTYKVDRLALNSDISFISFFSLGVRTLLRGVLCREPIRASKYVVKTILAHIRR